MAAAAAGAARPVNASADPLRAEPLTVRLVRAESELLASVRQLQLSDPAPAGPLPSATRRIAGVLEAFLVARGQELQPPPPADPILWLAYCRLGQQILSGGARLEGIDEPQRLRSRLERPLPPGAVVAWGDPDVYDAGEWRAVLALFQDGGDFVTDLEPPDPATYTALCHGIAEVRSLLGRIQPEQAATLASLQALTILARPGPEARRAGASFGGATTFFFRGASLVHASADLTLPGLLERLVHEAAHAELFVIAQDELLCSNDDAERYPVLIRSDPRPMNGILHSLHVLGRVCEALDAVLADGLRWRSDRGDLLQDCRSLRQRMERLGASSLAAVRRHGRLTALGQAVCEASARRLAGADGA